MKNDWGAPDIIDIELFQPCIVSKVVPDTQHAWDIPVCVKESGVAPFVDCVPAYNGVGKLLASWNRVRGAIHTVVMLHGGHGINTGNFHNAWWLINTVKVNVLLLDSYWSRGKSENFNTWNEYGANMRVIDALAAARFLAAQGVNPKRTLLMGDSQGGWSVLRAFTEGHSLVECVMSAYCGGIAMYPNCWSSDREYRRLPTLASNRVYVPPLGPYASPVIVFTGGNDTATPISEAQVDKTLKSAYVWHHYAEATHAWDLPFGGVGVEAQPDGRSIPSLNPHHVSRSVRNNAYTEHTHRTICEFLAEF